jgi:hypothetical protein
MRLRRFVTQREFRLGSNPQGVAKLVRAMQQFIREPITLH